MTTGVNDNFLSLDNTDYYQQQVFPPYPNAAVNCPRGPVPCAMPAAWQQYATSEVSAFAPGFKTPRVQQASLRLEREVGGRVHGEISYLFVHGVDMIRARDVNLPPPTYYSYPILRSDGQHFSECVLQRGVVLDVADELQHQLSVSAVHQSVATADTATGSDRSV